MNLNNLYSPDLNYKLKKDSDASALIHQINNTNLYNLKKRLIETIAGWSMECLIIKHGEIVAFKNGGFGIICSADSIFPNCEEEEEYITLQYFEKLPKFYTVSKTVKNHEIDLKLQSIANKNIEGLFFASPKTHDECACFATEILKTRFPELNNLYYLSDIIKATIKMGVENFEETTSATFTITASAVNSDFCIGNVTVKKSDTDSIYYKSGSGLTEIYISEEKIKVVKKTSSENNNWNHNPFHGVMISSRNSLEFHKI